MTTIIEGGTLVNEGEIRPASIIIEEGRITQITSPQNTPRGLCNHIVDATGCFVLPGIIDTHVHFREPGLTTKADISTESQAAAAGGVTSFLEMPNTVPQTTSLEALKQKWDLAQQKSIVNHAFFYGASTNNAHTFQQLDRTKIPGIKLFMGASTGGMQVDRLETLRAVFNECARLRLPLMTHCEDSHIIGQRMVEAKAQWGEDPPIQLHPNIRSKEACIKSSELAVQLAKQTGVQLHIAHLSTEEELTLFQPWRKEGVFLTADGSLPLITGEAVVGHLWFSDNDYERLGTRIKCNPAVHAASDRQALRSALTDGHICTIATDHAPHRLADKEGGAARAASGMPMVQFSLVAMLQLVENGVLTLQQLVWLMCHNPARLFHIKQRGFLRTGYWADLTLIKRTEPWVITDEQVLSRCAWTPLSGETMNWKVEMTLCNGHIVYDQQGGVHDYKKGQALDFQHPQPIIKTSTTHTLTT